MGCSSSNRRHTCSEKYCCGLAAVVASIDVYSGWEEGGIRRRSYDMNLIDPKKRVDRELNDAVADGGRVAVPVREVIEVKR